MILQQKLMYSYVLHVVLYTDTEWRYNVLMINGKAQQGRQQKLICHVTLHQVT